MRPPPASWATRCAATPAGPRSPHSLSVWPPPPWWCGDRCNAPPGSRARMRYAPIDLLRRCWAWTTVCAASVVAADSPDSAAGVTDSCTRGVWAVWQRLDPAHWNQTCTLQRMQLPPFAGSTACGQFPVTACCEQWLPRCAESGPAPRPQSQSQSGIASSAVVSSPGRELRQTAGRVGFCSCPA